MVRKGFEKELRKLEDSVVEMAELAKKSIDSSVDSLKNKDVKLAEKTIKFEKEMDQRSLNIENQCMRLTALQQPVAKDLRFIASMLKISDTLERVGDYAGKLAKITIKTKDKPLVKPLIDIPKMAELSKEMIDIDVASIRTKDVTGLEEKLTERDDVIDNLYEQIYRELLTMMIERPQIISDATDLIFAGRYLERIGDLACKVANRVIYMVDGRRTLIK
jgi:phosphate transport system protein